MASNYSVYIPRVFSNITEDKIRNIFTKMDIGEVSRVDFISKENSKGDKYYMVFVWFSHWNDTNSAAMNLKENIEDPNTQAKFVYDDPWYWILLPNTSKSETSTVDEPANTVQQQPVQQPVQQQPVQQQPVQQQPVQQQPVQQPVEQQSVYQQQSVYHHHHQMMLHHQQLMQQQQMIQQPMMYMQPGYYHQWNEHVPPHIEAPHGHGVMNAYYGHDHGFENPNAVEVSPQDAAMMDEIEKMMDAE